MPEPQTLTVKSDDWIMENLKKLFTEEQIDRLKGQWQESPTEALDGVINPSQARLLFEMMLDSYAASLIEESGDTEVQFDLALFGLGMMSLGANLKEIMNG